MRSLFALLAAIFLLSCQHVSAWPAHGNGVIPPPGPVLQNVAVTFGNRTLSGYGEVQLNTQDQNYGTGYNPKGLDVLVSGTCAKWSTSQTGGTAGHFNTISHVADGASAVTPTPTSAGASAQLNGGPYTFLVTCEDASNNSLATATLTYNISTGTANNCGAVNIGPFDNTGVSYVPSGFASTLDGCAVYLSTGYFKTTALNLGMGFTHPVTLTCADGATKCGVLYSIGTGSNSTHAIVKDINVSSPSTTGTAAAAFVLSGADITGDNLHAWSNLTQRTAGSYQCIQTNASSGTITHFGCEWVRGFFTIHSNWTYQYGYSRYASADAILTGSGNQNNFHIKDMTIMSMKQPVSNHPDVFQINDGSTPSDYSVERIMAISAGGDVLFQGPFFGGGISGVPTPSAAGPWMGYIDDGTAGHGPGNILTVTSVGGMQSNATGSRIYSLSGTPIGLSDVVTANCGGTPCPYGVGKKYTLTGYSGNYGSAASPAQFYGLENINATWDMVWNSGDVIQGTFYSGSSGTSSLTHFTHMRETTTGVTGIGAPFLKFQNCAYPVYNGALTVSKGAEYSSWASDCTPTTNPPPNVTVSNTFNAAGNSTTLASWYVNGDPKTCLEAKSTAQWDAMTVQNAMIYAASCTVVKPGSALDLTTDVANAIGTDAVTPKWADGTVVGTGFTGY